MLPPTPCVSPFGIQGSCRKAECQTELRFTLRSKPPPTGTARQTWVYDVDGVKLKGVKPFVKLTDGAGPSAADGIRADKDGNIWAGAAPGVQIIAPDGVVIGQIKLPENCANICFGGSRRNRLFMTASQSLYAVYVGVTGGHIA